MHLGALEDLGRSVEGTRDMGCILCSWSAAARGETDDVSYEPRLMGCLIGRLSAAGCETDDVS